MGGGKNPLGASAPGAASPFGVPDGTRALSSRAGRRREGSALQAVPVQHGQHRS